MNSSTSKEDKDADADANTSATTPTTALVPQLSEFGITEQDLATAIRVLDAVSSLDPKNKKKKMKKKRKADALAKKNANANTYNTTDNDDNNDNNNDGLSQYKQPNLRPLRKSLSATLSLHQQTMYEGKSELDYYEQRLAGRSLKRQKMAENAQQKKYVASTDLRKGRVEKLERLRREEGREEEEGKLLRFLIPDGHVDTASTNGGDDGIKMLENGGGNGNGVATEEDGKKQSIKTNNSNNPDNNAQNENNNNNNTTVLPKLRSCYVCKIRYRILHHFYDQLCPTCAPYNYAKRHQTANLSNCIAVVTGSRVKIGFQVCLKLLRAGCTVVATTRFPNNAVDAYRRESDFQEWKDRLHVYGLDLRDVTGLEAFTRFLKVAYGERGIDILINNACQTVRRPGGYYVPLVEREGRLWTEGDEAHRGVLRGCMEFERIRRRLVTDHAGQDGGGNGNGGNLLSAGVVNPPSSGREKLLLGNGAQQGQDDVKEGSAAAAAAVKVDTGTIVQKPNNTTSTNNKNVPFETTGISHSAAMSQMAIVPEDVGIDEKTLPAGLSDINGQQLDLRSNNSWLLKMDQVSTPELMECMFVNAIAPFVLNSRLTPLMEAPASDVNRPDRYIINVSAMEGKFYRYKMPNHPHTNMAKAALNMLTRTSSEDLAKKSRVFMNSVDTGWINDENPLEKASKIAKTNLFQTPIDEVDAAARILDPVFVGVNLDKETENCDKNAKAYGKFFKDFKESEW
ncbi:hypothetical protein ACHAXR_011935 [Thalassiosira sp. AJA248-18]